MNLILTADIGSTFTKLTVIDLEAPRIVATARAFTTIESNVLEGFEAAEKELRALAGPMDFRLRLASSSAAGGLKMVAVGLVPDLTVQAARLAAANAGAKIQKTFAFELNREEVEEIVALAPDIILLCGGTDGGNKEVIVHNAGALAASGLACPLVAAGNKSAADDLKEALRNYGGEIFFCDNVMPSLGELNVLPAQRAIRDLFIKNIVSAKGLAQLAASLDRPVIPTPLAVFEAAKLLSLGGGQQPGLGELMLFDVGGATTDVYSMAEGLPARPDIFLQGLREPFAKRTVEGDLGLRYSLRSLLACAGEANLAEELGLAAGDLENWLAGCVARPGLVPEDGLQKRLDDALAGAAVGLAAARHCGRLETLYTLTGRAFAQRGKDLSQVGLIVGTGGPIIKAARPAEVLGRAVYSPADLDLLKPLKPRLLLDARYIMAAMGLIAELEPETALKIMLEEMKEA